MPGTDSGQDAAPAPGPVTRAAARRPGFLDINGPLRTWLEQQHIAYVLAVARDHRVPAGAGRTVRADALAARLPRRAWQRLSAGDGAKGHRWRDWAWVTISNPGPGHQCLLIRRNRSTGELAFYHCYSPQPVTLAALVNVAGPRWTIEENFQASKGLTGLDEHQMRRWNSWYRWVTRRDRPPPRHSDCPPGRDAGHRLRWSHWRRRQGPGGSGGAAKLTLRR